MLAAAAGALERAVFRATWTWVVPLVGAAAVFVGVMLTTPPGFRTIVDVVFGSPRGTVADIAAYTIGSAASLALASLIVVAVACSVIDLLLRRARNSFVDRD